MIPMAGGGAAAVISFSAGGKVSGASISTHRSSTGLQQIRPAHRMLLESARDLLDDDDCIFECKRA